MTIEVNENKPERRGDTLDDLKSRDIDNLEYSLTKKGKTFVFSRLIDAVAAVGEMMTTALEHCGVHVDAIKEKAVSDQDVAGILAEELMDRNGVRIESRMQYDGDDAWRRGTYIYKNGEIAYFIGQISRSEIAPFVYKVKTTVPYTGS